MYSVGTTVLNSVIIRRQSPASFRDVRNRSYARGESSSRGRDYRVRAIGSI
jgi:hypothetical protein